MKSQSLKNKNFENKIYKLVGNEYSLVGNYKNESTKVKMKHNKCGTIFLTTATSFFYKYRYLHNYKPCACPVCRKIIRTNKRDKHFRNRVKHLYHNEYTVLGHYKGERTKIKVRHNKCEYTYLVTPEQFLIGHYLCPVCHHHSNSLNTRSFKSRVKRLVGDKYSVIGTYVNSHTRIKMRHNKCGYIFKIHPYIFLDNPQCPRCQGRVVTQKSFIAKVHNLVGNEYSVIGTYINSYTKIKMKHNKCGHTFYVRPNNFLYNSNQCPYCCDGRKSDLTTDDFKRNVKSLVGNEYTVLGHYKNNYTKVKMQHNKCGYIFCVRPRDFLRKNGSRCPKCNHSLRMNTKRFKIRVKHLTGKKYIVLSKCHNSKTKIIMEHRKCHRKFITTPDSFLQGKRCPYCRISHGEAVIERYLSNHHYKECLTAKVVKKHSNTFLHSYHVTYHGHKLSYDFLININNKLYTIEFDGSQHFRIVDFSWHYYDYIKNHTLSSKKPRIYKKLKKNLLRQHKHDKWKDIWSSEYLHHHVIRIKNPKNLQRKALHRLVKGSLDKALKKIDSAQTIAKLIKLTKNW